MVTIADSWGLYTWILLTIMVMRPGLCLQIKPALGGYICKVEALLFEVPVYLKSISRPLGATGFDLQSYLNSIVHSILS